MSTASTTHAVQGLLDELAASGTVAGDGVVRDIIARSASRLHLLCARLLHHDYPRLTREPAYLDSEDVLGGVVERLIRAMSKERPTTVRGFFGLANQHIRWELNEMARQVDRGKPVKPLKEFDPAARPDQAAPEETATLRTILDAIDGLPSTERETFEFVRIQGMTHAEAAAVLGVAEKTVQRRLRRAVLLLTDALRDLTPPGREDRRALS